MHKGLLGQILWWLEHQRREKSCLERVIRWLDTIGAEARREIRSLEVEVHCDDLTTAKKFVPFVDDLHAKLSDEATVVYRAVSREEYDTLVLRDLGHVFYLRDPTHVPLLEHPEWTTRNDANPWTFQIQYLSKRDRKRAPRPRMTFKAGLGWFGNQPKTGRRTWFTEISRLLA